MSASSAHGRSKGWSPHSLGEGIFSSPLCGFLSPSTFPTLSYLISSDENERLVQVARGARRKMEERMTLCKMVTQAGGKNGTMPADATTYKYLEESSFPATCNMHRWGVQSDTRRRKNCITVACHTTRGSWPGCIMLEERNIYC